jgi:hypothetical protein
LEVIDVEAENYVDPGAPSDLAVRRAERHWERERKQAAAQEKKAKEKREAAREAQERADRRVRIKAEVLDEDVMMTSETINIEGEVSGPPPRFHEDASWGACVACKWPVDRKSEHRTCGLATCLRPGCGAEMCIHCWQRVQCHLRCRCGRN